MVFVIALAGLQIFSIAQIHLFLRQLVVAMVKFAPYLGGAQQRSLDCFPHPFVLPLFSFEDRHF